MIEATAGKQHTVCLNAMGELGTPGNKFRELGTAVAPHLRCAAEANGDSIIAILSGAKAMSAMEKPGVAWHNRVVRDGSGDGAVRLRPATHNTIAQTDVVEFQPP